MGACSQDSAHWSCLAVDVIMINVDGTSYSDGEKFGLGFVARDFAGNLVMRFGLIMPRAGLWKLCMLI